MATYTNKYRFTGDPEDIVRTENFNKTNEHGRGTVNDSRWNNNSFLAVLGNLRDKNLSYENTTENDFAFANIFQSSADRKFSDSSIGGRVGVGGKPQFTRYADIRAKGLLASRNSVTLDNINGNIGMGRLHSEMIDDPQELLYLEFGIPSFNSLTGFLRKFSDSALIKLATGGKAQGFMYEAAQTIGNIAAVLTLPVFVTLTAVTIHSTKWFALNRTSRFYSVEPQMVLYWKTVNTIINKLCMNRGVLPRILPDDSEQLAQAEKVMARLAEMLPGVFSLTNGVNVPLIISTPTRRSRLLRKKELEGFNSIASALSNSVNNRQAGINAFVGSLTRSEHDSQYALLNDLSTLDATVSDYSIDKMIDTIRKTDWYKAKESDDPSDPLNDNGMYASKPIEQEYGDRFTGVGFETEAVFTGGNPVNSTAESIDVSVDANGQFINTPNRISNDRENKDSAGFFGSLSAIASDGLSHAVFRVNHIRTVTDSFSNSVKANALTGGLQGAASTARSVKFGLAGGNLGDNMIFDGIESVIKGLGNVLDGVVDGYTYGASGTIMDILRGAQVEIPSYWESSDSSTVSTSDFTMDLTSIYGNVFSQIKNQYLPIAMLAAGVWPLKTGAQSHISPFVCRAHLLGKHQSAVSMITALTIERGTTYLPFDTGAKALGIKVSFTVTSLSAEVSAPISTDAAFRPSEFKMDEDNAYSDYLQNLAAMSYEDQSVTINGLRVRLASTLRDFRAAIDPASQSLAYFGNNPSRILTFPFSTLSNMRAEQNR